MDFKEYIASLEPYIAKVGSTDNIELWHSEVKTLDARDRKYVFEFAEKRWIKRKLNDGTLLFHPEVSQELASRLAADKAPLKKHKQMVFANLLASYEKEDSKKYFERMKRKIINKYNSLWWKGVYDKIKPFYAAHHQLNDLRNGAVGRFSERSIFMGGLTAEQVSRILAKLPKE